MSYALRILGCGSSGGVPRIGDNWGKCDPANPKNRRRRCSVLIQRHGPHGVTNVLVDTSPDLREQLLDARLATVDAVIFTHDHADHTHGIDDLRVASFNRKSRIPAYADVATTDTLLARFGYCFEMPPGGSYPPILALNAPLVAGEEVTISGAGGDVTIQPFNQQHGDIISLGLRCGGLAYSCDVSDLPDDSLDMLRNLDVWIVDALRYIPHPGHFTVAQALEWVARVQPRTAWLTHLHIDLDYDALSAELPDTVHATYDGLVIAFEA